MDSEMSTETCIKYMIMGIIITIVARFLMKEMKI